MEELKQEAIKRLEILKLDSKIIQELKTDDKVYVSKIENGTTEVKYDNEIMDLIKMLEQKETIKIYHVIIFDSTMYFLAIHTHQEEWQKEKSDLKRGFIEIVITKSVIEFTSRNAGIETENGKIKKVVL